MNRYRTLLARVAAVMCLATGGCATDEGKVDRPAASPSAAETESPSPGTEATGSPSPQDGPLVVGQGSTENGIDWRLVVRPGNPVCVQLRRTDDVGDFLVCDEDSEQDYNGDERLRYAFGGLNEEQVPKFVIGITVPGVEKIRIDLPDGPSPEVQTLSSPAAPDHLFFVVELDPDPPQEVQAVRGLDRGGRTVAGFRLGPMDEPPSPLPTA